MVLLLVTLLLETFFRLEPLFLNIFVNVNHELEYLLEDVFDEIDVLLGDARLALDKCHHEFEGLLSDG